MYCNNEFCNMFYFFNSTSVKICVRTTLLHSMCILALFNGTIYTEGNKCEQKKRCVEYLFRVQVLLSHLFKLEAFTMLLLKMQTLIQDITYFYYAAIVINTTYKTGI